MNKSYIPALLILILLAFLHYCGNHFYLYVHLKWYDIMMHILGGAGIALSTYWVWATATRKPISRRHVAYIILVTFIAGAGWEIMEAIYDIAGSPVGTTPYWIDTVKDLFDDTLGSIIIYFIVREK